MICFYLVLFYTTLIMLSRQVRRGGPPAPRPRAAPCSPRGAGAGAGRGPAASGSRTEDSRASCLSGSPSLGARAAPGPAADRGVEAAEFGRDHACAPAPAPGATLTPPRLQIDYYCRLDCLWKNKFKKEHEEFETMENVNRLLLENVLPAHVAAHFIGDKLNEVWWSAARGGARKVQRPGRREPRFPGPRFPVCEPGPLPPAWQAGCARRRRAFVTDEHACFRWSRAAASRPRTGL